MPVDLYVGGPEHAVMHLLYFRFWHRVMRELGLTHEKALDSEKALEARKGDDEAVADDIATQVRDRLADLAKGVGQRAIHSCHTGSTRATGAWRRSQRHALTCTDHCAPVRRSRTA